MKNLCLTLTTSFLVFCCLFLAAAVASAAMAIVEVDTGTKHINALEGTLVLPADMNINEIHTGNSAILVWITPPKWVGSTITFAGITPGGFMGTYLIFTIDGEFNAKDLEKVSFESVNALKNDGSGTSVPVTISLSLAEPKGDTELPENFAPVVARDPDIFDGQYMLMFSTQDKGFGIDHYEVREGYFGKFVVAESPYVLQDQSLGWKIFVKAVDKAGNERVAVLYPSPWAQWKLVLPLVTLIVSVLVFAYAVRKRLWRTFIKQQ